MPDSSAVDAALCGLLAADGALTSLMPDGVYIDLAVSPSRSFVIVSQLAHSDTYILQTAGFEIFTYLVKAVTMGSSSGPVKSAAARIQTILQEAQLHPTGYTDVRVQRIERVRYTEIDEVSNERWHHCGGHYEVWVQPGESAAPPPIPLIEASDAFNRPDGPIGGNWIVPQGFAVPLIVSNQIVGNAMGAIYNAPVWAPDQFSAIRRVSGSVAVRVRFIDFLHYYEIYVNAAGTLFFQKRTEAGYTTFATVPGAVSPGDVIRLEAEADTLRAKVNGAVVASIIDTGYRTGGVGFGTGSDSGSVCDDWSGGMFA